MDLIAQYSSTHFFYISVVLVHFFFGSFGLARMVDLLSRGSVRLPYPYPSRYLKSLYYGIFSTLLAVTSVVVVAVFFGVLDYIFLTVLSFYDPSIHYEFLVVSNPSRVIVVSIIVCLVIYAPVGLCSLIYNDLRKTSEYIDSFYVGFGALVLYVSSIIAAHTFLSGLWFLLYYLRFPS